jgi:hypothetical protein
MRRFFSWNHGPLLIGIIAVAVIVVIGFYLYPHTITKTPSVTSRPETATSTSQSQSLVLQSSSANQSSGTALVDISPKCVFSSDPLAVFASQPAQLNWSCQNVTKCSISSDQGKQFNDQGPTGSLSVGSMFTTTHFTLSCENANKIVFLATTTVVVHPPVTQEPGQPFGQ